MIENDEGWKGQLPGCNVNHKQVISGVTGCASLGNTGKQELNSPNSYSYFFYFHFG